MTQPDTAVGTPVELSLEQRVELSQCLSDLHAISTSHMLLGGLLNTGTSAAPVEVTDALGADLTRAAEENAARWRRLNASAEFIVGLVPLVPEENIELALRTAGLHGSPVGETFLQKTQAEGGAAQFIRARTDRIKPGFADELNRAIELYAYWASWPRGRGADGQPSGIVSDFAGSLAGCAGGVALLAVGGIAIGVALTTAVLSAGLSAPASVSLAIAGTTAVAVGGILVVTSC
jgi:hypothetical protein